MKTGNDRGLEVTVYLLYIVTGFSALRILAKVMDQIMPGMEAYLASVGIISIGGMLLGYLPLLCMAPKAEKAVKKLNVPGRMKKTDWLFLTAVLVCLVASRILQKPAAAGSIWENLMMQAGGIVFLFTAFKSLAGTLTALGACAGILFLPGYLNSSYVSDPQSAVLLLLGAELFVLALVIDKNKKWLFLFGMLCGISGCIRAEYLVLIPILLMGRGFNKEVRKEWIWDSLFLLNGVLVSGMFFWCIQTWMAGERPWNLLAAVKLWSQDPFRSGQNIILHSTTLGEYMLLLLFHLLIMLSLPVIYKTKDKRFVWWIIPYLCLYVPMQFWEVHIQQQGILHILSGIMAAGSISAILLSSCREKESIMNENRIMEPQPYEEKKEKNRPKPGEYLDNPLPVPKKHVKKELDYAFEPEQELLFYEIPVLEDDDFDIR